MTRVRAFLLIAGGLLALYYIAEAVWDYGQVPVLTEHQPALVLRHDPQMADQLLEDIAGLHGVVRTDLSLARYGLPSDPQIRGDIHYDQFRLAWMLEPRLEGFSTRVRPMRPRWGSEPDPHDIDAAMIALGTLIEQNPRARAIFLSVEELGAS
jgi:hypothetical protein